MNRGGAGRHPAENITEAIERRLTAAYWPWPLALAYSQPVEIRREAVTAVVTFMEECANESGLSPFASVGALGRLLQVTAGGTDDPYWVGASKAETYLLGAIGSDKSVQTLGRISPDATLSDIKATDWVGCQIDYDVASDLVMAGWREADFLSRALDEVTRKVRFYDIHVLRDQMKDVFGLIPRLVEKPWSEEEMGEAIRACPQSDRDKAWRDHFKKIQARHQWKADAFRSFWSTARGTKGMGGRPKKPA